MPQETNCEVFTNTFAPVIAIRARLADQRERLAAFDREFLQFVTRSNRTTTAGPVEIPYECLLVIGRRRV
jgi:hypothetical protein